MQRVIRSLGFAPAIVVLLTALQAQSQILPLGFRFDGIRTKNGSDTRPLSNSAIDIRTRSDTIWVGGGKGIDLSPDGGFTWRHIGSEEPFEHEDVAAFNGCGPVLWASLAGSERLKDGTEIPKGLGLAVSTDNGKTWSRIEQPRENENDSTFLIEYGINKIKGLAITTTYNNITYDIAVTSSSVWIASFAGGLRRSTDGGRTFHPIVLPSDEKDSIRDTDTLDFALSPVDRPDFWNSAGTVLGMRGSLNHRVFSVLATGDSTVWVGTAGGINRTTDNGRSWRKFTFSNQSQPISGNFVVALGRNVIGGIEHIWASTINALDPHEFRAVSVTSDNGETWRTALRGEFTHNFGFKDSIVYAATNSGIFRSADGGRTWTLHSVFVDPLNRNRSIDPRCYAVAAAGDTIWISNVDGLLKTVDCSGHFFGAGWTMLRAARPLSSGSSAYAYPNPFIPVSDVCRIRYRTASSGKATIEVFDYALFPVRTVIRNAPRPPNLEQDEIWDGTDDAGKRVANGLYYIRIQTGEGEDVWTKVVVLQ
ncbi:MAG: hypothetical protein QHI48_03020 [Bacteroidota bacterium]|nr:hypothetical protein [Bacteroidota bacterium]